MAGEIEEPFRLNFQAGSLHSGSISFGRFESEVLCWERRSSFSHNRYLEEVEKCSTPGLVTEKKAYFEAHFRKKRLMHQNSPDSQNEIECQTSDNGISEKTGCDEASDHMDAGNYSARFDENLNGSLYGREQESFARFDEGFNGSLNGVEQEATQCEVFGTLSHEAQIEVSCEDFDDADYVSEIIEVEEVHHPKLGDLLSLESASGIEMKENFHGKPANFGTRNLSDQDICPFPDTHEPEENTTLKHGQDSSPKEKVPSVGKCVKPRVTPRLSVANGMRPVSSKEFKASANKSTGKVNDVQKGSKAEIKVSPQNKSQMDQTTKYETDAKRKGNAMKSAGSRNRIDMDPRHSTLQKVSYRAHQSPNRAKSTIGAAKLDNKKENSGPSNNSIKLAQRRKEFDVKLEEKLRTKEHKLHQLHAKTLDKKAETKQLTQSHNLRAMPVSSYSHGALRESDRNKAIASIVKPQKLRTNSSSIRTRASERRDQAISVRGAPKQTDETQASGMVSSLSTVTSDSTPSSPAAEISSRHLPQAGQKKEKEKEKRTIVSKNPEDNQFYKGKTMGGNQKTRTGTRTTHRAAFKNSSRTGHVAVNVAS